MIEIYARELGPVQANCYIIKNNGHCLIVDPGGEYPGIEKVIKDDIVDAILLTHAHFDHIGGLDALLKKYPVDVYVHPKEVNFLSDARYNVSEAFFAHIVSNAKAKAIAPGKQTIGTFEVEVMYTPGHSIGSVVYIIDRYLFSGDTLFQGSIGRTDMVTGSMTEMRQSLDKIKQLKRNYTIYPGHGPDTTLEQELSWNPYLR